MNYLSSPQIKGFFALVAVNFFGTLESVEKHGKHGNPGRKSLPGS